MSEMQEGKPGVARTALGIRRRRQALTVMGGVALVVAAFGLAPTPAIGNGQSTVKLQLPGNGFPIQPTEPPASWTLQRAATGSVDCETSPPTTTACVATFQLFAAQLSKSGLPTRTDVLLSTMTLTYLRGTHQVAIHFTLSHKILDLLYKYADPRCYVVSRIGSPSPTNPNQPQATSKPTSTKKVPIK
jgi:hypothetical protein